MSKRSRLERKAARIEKTAAERQMDEVLGKIRAARDKALNDASSEYQKAIKAATEARAKARREAQERYEEERAAAIKAAAMREAA